MHIINRTLLTPLFIITLTLSLTSNNANTSARHIARMTGEEALPTLRLLTFDGGGTRGVISLKIAEEIKRRLGWECLSDGVEWFGGSSTGSIVATGLANGLPCDRIEKIYTEEGPLIFEKSWWRKVWSFQEELYDDDAFVTALQGHFKENTIKTLRRDIVVLANDIEGGNGQAPGPVVFNSGFPGHQDIPLWTIPRASSSAPTYFKPFYDFRGRSLIDAGTVANMPTETAIASILELYDDETYKEVRDNIKIVSIGTGIFDAPISRKESSRMGFLHWAPKITTLMINDTTKLQVANLSRTYRGNFVRLDPVLERRIHLDATSPDDFAYMREVAQDYIASEEGNLAIEQAVALLQGETLSS